MLDQNKILLIIIALWELSWKGIALWKSARNNQRNWFLAIFILNTLGILPIVYLWKSKQLEDVVFGMLKFFRLKK